MPFTVRIDPVANSQQASIIPDATTKNVGVMTELQAQQLADLVAASDIDPFLKNPIDGDIEFTANKDHKIFVDPNTNGVIDTLTVAAGDDSGTGTAGRLNLKGGDGSAGNNPGGDTNLTGGPGGGGAAGGHTNVQSGNGGDSVGAGGGDGGSATLKSGNGGVGDTAGGSAGAGGGLTAQSGNGGDASGIGPASDGGPINVRGGNGGAGSPEKPGGLGANVVILAGDGGLDGGGGGGNGGNVAIDAGDSAATKGVIDIGTANAAQVSIGVRNRPIPLIGLPVLPVYAGGSRPAANTVPVGTTIYNSTTSIPNFSDGAAWRDAAGNPV